MAGVTLCIITRPSAAELWDRQSKIAYFSAIMLSMVISRLGASPEGTDDTLLSVFDGRLVPRVR